jgi:pseudouridine synthase
MIRLQKHIANLGICSRRKAEAMIAAGRVKVNGTVVREMGVQVDPEKDQVDVIGATTPAKAPSEFIYILLNKPVDFISSSSSAQGASVLELLTKANNIKPQFGRDILERVFPVGRLDKDSEGLMLLTNDGALANRLTHPRYEHEKEYEVTISGRLSPDARKILSKGMRIDSGFVHGIKIIKEIPKGTRSTIRVVLKEGKNRQIRKMFGRIGYPVISLKRTRMGKLNIGVLPVGKWKFVHKDMIV